MLQLPYRNPINPFQVLSVGQPFFVKSECITHCASNNLLLLILLLLLEIPNANDKNILNVIVCVAACLFIYIYMSAAQLINVAVYALEPSDVMKISGGRNKYEINILLHAGRTRKSFNILKSYQHLFS